MAGDRWWKGFIWQARLIIIGWAEGWQMGFEWGLSSWWMKVSQSGQHQMLNVIQKRAFHFLFGEGWRMGFKSIDQPSRSSEVNIIQKEHFMVLAGEGWQREFHWPPGQSSEVECNPKMSNSFFWVERGGGWGLSPLTSPADHQKLNVIQKEAFYFIGWRWVMDGVQVHWPGWPIIRSWT